MQRREGEALERNGPTQGASPQAEVESVAEVAELGQRELRDIGLSEHVAQWVTLFFGSMLFVWLHVAWFSAWILVNTGVLGITSFDEFPFTFLTMIVSLEAIFLSTFVLITQNQQNRESDRRAKVNLEVNTIAEREITKVLELLRAVHDRLGIDTTHDHQLTEMQQKTRVGDLAEQTDRAEQRNSR